MASPFYQKAAYSLYSDPVTYVCSLLKPEGIIIVPKGITIVPIANYCCSFHLKPEGITILPKSITIVPRANY